ncbi:unnamed protein product [Linum tenue]|uniref:Uncharacterized protein n=1 Tax=Linum tenue TaxID=586396 RepID=A0AAV0P9Y2_9ROSI|nr:unnamed protein product [Linum tenue]
MMLLCKHLIRQAHMRGHQIRRLNEVGLRGFHVKEMDQVLESETNEYEFLITGRQQKSAVLGKAVARVTSMVRRPEARDQYLRLVTKLETLQVVDRTTVAIPSTAAI